MLLRLLLAVLAFLLIRWVIIKLANLKETPKDKNEPTPVVPASLEELQVKAEKVAQDKNEIRGVTEETQKQITKINKALEDGKSEEN